MSEVVKFKNLMFIRYLGDSFFYPFLALYLHSLTFGEARIGYLIAIIPFISIFCNPIYSRICKNTNTLRNVLGIISFVEALVIIAIVFITNYYALLACIILLAISGTSHYGLLDSYSTNYAKINNINFSILRVYGSIAYIVGIIGAGYVVKLVGYKLAFIICAVLFMLCTVIYWSFKPIYDEVNNFEEKRSYKEVFKNKGYIIFLIFYVFCYGVLKANNNYYGLLLESRGIGSTGYGYIYAGCVFVEVICLLLFNKFEKKLNFKLLMFLSMLSICILCLVNGSNLPIYVIAGFCALRGIAFSILLHVNYKILVNLVGVRNSTIVIMLEELGVNILVIILSTIGGNIIEYVSYNAFYLTIGSIGVINLIYYLIFVMKYVIKNDKNEVINV